jgi:hypothetical protein
MYLGGPLFIIGTKLLQIEFSGFPNIDMKSLLSVMCCSHLRKTTIFIQAWNTDPNEYIKWIPFYIL